MDWMDFLNQLPLVSSEMMSPELLLGLVLGVGLSASCGFRVFVPPLVMSAAALFFGFDLPAEMSWLGSVPAMAIFLTATVLEVGAYYVPWVDNVLDSIAGPAAVSAGPIITSSFISGGMDPTLQWTIALVAGGGAAGAVQSATTATRMASSTMTAGIANPVISTVENALAVAMPILTIIFPLVAFVITLAVLFLVVKAGVQLVRFLLNRFAKKPEPKPKPIA